MNKTNYVNLPVIARVQHGEKVNNKVIEYGYFIAKSDNDYMQSYLQKFNKLYNKKQSLDVEFFSEDPLTIKYVRYNQSGEVCRCPDGSNKATQRVKNGWQKIDCDTFSCQYRKKNEQGKCACNRIGWLKFLLPNISTDRIFLMRITGQTSLNRLSDYFALQKAQGHSIKGHYTIFLKQEEQSNILGKTFNNYILDILRKEDFISTKQPPEIIENTENNSQKASDTIENKGIISNDLEAPAPEPKTSSKKTTKKTTSKKSSSTKKTTSSSNSQSKEANQSVTVSDNSEDDKFKNCYALLKTFEETIAGHEYLVGEFADMQDKISNIVIRPEDALELSKCDLGTFVRMDVSEIKGKQFAMKLEFIEKTLKKVAA